MIGARKDRSADDIRFQNDHLIAASPQPIRGNKQSLLRTDLPISAEVMPIDPNMAFAPSRSIQERIADGLQLERTAVKGRHSWRQSSVGKFQSLQVI